MQEFDEKMVEKIEEVGEALFRIKQWSKAYPEDIFIPPTAEQWKQAHEYFKEHWGFSIDKISGEYGRRIFKGVGKYIEQAEKALEELQSAIQAYTKSEQQKEV